MSMQLRCGIAIHRASSVVLKVAAMNLAVVSGAWILRYALAYTAQFAKRDADTLTVRLAHTLIPPTSA